VSGSFRNLQKEFTEEALDKAERSLAPTAHGDRFSSCLDLISEAALSAFGAFDRGGYGKEFADGHCYCFKRRSAAVRHLVCVARSPEWADCGAEEIEHKLGFLLSLECHDCHLVRLRAQRAVIEVGRSIRIMATVAANAVVSASWAVAYSRWVVESFGEKDKTKAEALSRASAEARGNKAARRASRVQRIGWSLMDTFKEAIGG